MGKFSEISKELNDRSFIVNICCLDMNQEKAQVGVGFSGDIELIANTLLQIMKEKKSFASVILYAASQYVEWEGNSEITQLILGAIYNYLNETECNCKVCSAARKQKNKYN